MSSTPGSKSEAESAVSSALANAAKLVLASEAARKSAAGMKAFRFNSEAKYQPGLQKAAARDVGDLRIGRVRVQADDPQKFFEVTYPDIFEHYILPTSYSDKPLQAWHATPMQFWQNQLNFAVWCATTGCGVSVEDHLTPDDSLLQSVYRFHVYYQIRRILEEIQAPLPYYDAWNAIENYYNRKGYEKICDEFGVSPNSDWRVSGPNQGFGQAFNYFPDRGYCLIGDGEYLPGKMSFIQKANDDFHVDYIKQETNAVSGAWRLFMLNKSDGLTHPGVERLDDSIQTYVWSVLTAQVQIRTSILGTGAAFRAQTQFKTNVETSITSPVDLEAAIIRYQEVVQHARSELNFSFGEGLVMAPGDILLRIGKIVGYNNNIIIATSSQHLGLNKGLNKSDAPPDAANDTGEKGLVKPMGADSEAATSQHPATAKPTPATTTAAEKADHEDEKTALIVGSIAISLGLLWFLR